MFTVGVQLRAKIEAIIARGGGIPDADAPEVLEETKYWGVVKVRSRDYDDQKTPNSVSASCAITHWWGG